LSLNTEFYDFIFEKNKIIGIKTNKGDILSNWVINCSGLYSDDVMHKANIKPDFKIKPTRGEYFIFDAAKVTLNTVLYPTPTEKGKGTLVSTTTHGNVMVGPNAEVIEDRENAATTKEGLEKIIMNAKKLVPSLNIKDVIAQFAGIRAKGNEGYKDFIIEIPNEIQGLLNLGAIDSPGLASAPAIAEHVINLLKANNESLIEKKEWNPKRSSRPCFKKLSHLERMELVKKNPKYGKVICRCEEVTEGEIIDAINSKINATTYDAIKRRTWMGTGRCQGAFDYHRVIEILSRELKIPETEVTKKSRDSKFIFKKTKE
jgi:glycerol-3-phosphate dehydrogenase